MKLLRKWLFRPLLILLALILMYCLTGAILGLIPVNHDFEEDPDGIEIAIYTTGIHLDVVLPIENEVFDWHTILDATQYDNAHLGDYLALGWGDSAFYITTPTWGDLSASVTLASLFLPTASAMHTISFDTPPVNKIKYTSLKVSPEQYRSLVRYLVETLRLDADGRSMHINCCKDHHAGNDGFIEAGYTYHVFYTCNDWLNRGFKQAGLPAVLWTPFDKLILSRWNDVKNP
ncbi:MAG: DUF2459 domain-containing protein [Bacteroidota bacterium]